MIKRRIQAVTQRDKNYNFSSSTIQQHSTDQIKIRTCKSVLRHMKKIWVASSSVPGTAYRELIVFLRIFNPFVCLSLWINHQRPTAKNTNNHATNHLGSISAALSCLVYPPRVSSGRSAGSFPEQRLVIEPMVVQDNNIINSPRR